MYMFMSARSRNASYLFKWDDHCSKACHRKCAVGQWRTLSKIRMKAIYDQPPTLISSLCSSLMVPTPTSSCIFSDHGKAATSLIFLNWALKMPPSPPPPPPPQTKRALFLPLSHLYFRTSVLSQNSLSLRLLRSAMNTAMPTRGKITRKKITRPTTRDLLTGTENMK